MPELSEIGQVETRADGSKVFTHGHRFPDNVQKIVQEYDANGRLTSVRAELTGFAGKILDVTAQVDSDGNVLHEEGYRAPEVTTTLKEMIRPLPAEEKEHVVRVPQESSKVADQAEKPVAQAVNLPEDGIRAGLERIYGRLENLSS